MTDAELDDLTERLHSRATIRRQIGSRKSVQEGKPDRIADLLDEAGNAISEIRPIRFEKVTVVVRNERRLADEYTKGFLNHE